MASANPGRKKGPVMAAKRRAYSSMQLRVGLVVLFASATVATAAVFALAGDHFVDVEPRHTHAPGIAYLAEAGVSEGCRDGTAFCSGDSATRGQVATFLYRASGHDPATSPSVNAATVGGMTAEDLQVPGPPGPAGPPGPPGQDADRGPHLTHYPLKLGGLGSLGASTSRNWEFSCGGGPPELCAVPINRAAIPEEATLHVDYRFLVNDLDNPGSRYTVCVRLRNLTLDETVAGSEVCRTEVGPHVVRVPVTLPVGDYDYGIEIRGEDAEGISSDTRPGTVRQVIVVAEYVP